MGDAIYLDSEGLAKVTGGLRRTIYASGQPAAHLDVALPSDRAGAGAALGRLLDAERQLTASVIEEMDELAARSEQIAADVLLVDRHTWVGP